jgi:hypothetical protein
MGVIEGNRPASDNDWESIKRRGDTAIESWIDQQLIGKSCTILLIGSSTANRKWINYEIVKSWNSKKGIIGVHIHNLADRDGMQAVKGRNPFSCVTFGSRQLSDIVPTYDPPYSVSTNVYAYIEDNLAGWIEEGIRVRNNF